MRLIGVDVGGTFTDLVYADTEAGETAVHKVSTTPDDPSRGVVAGLMALCDKYGIPRETIDMVFHGTTIATNAVLEHDGARHRHGHHRRLSRHPAHRPPPAAAALLDHAGDPLAGPAAGQAPPPQDGEGAAGAAARARCWSRSTRTGVRQAARELKEAGVEAIAVCFLFSYLDPRTRSARARSCARSIPECFVTTSPSVSPQFREFERFTTTAMNAFIGPKVRNYVTRLEAELGASGFKADLRIMASNGGVATPGDGGRAAGAHAALGPGGRRARRRLGGRPVRAGATSSPSTSAAPAPTSAS